MTNTSQPQQSKAYMIAFCALSGHGTNDKFVKKQLQENIFKDYVDGVKENNGAALDELDNKMLYVPEIYNLWGRYDICIISEVDDLEFATRFFRPYNAIKEKQVIDYTNFDYKVLTGINPIVCKSEENSLPYLTVTELKISSAFLLGNGILMVSSIVKKMVEIIEQEKNTATNQLPEIKVNYRICESYSYHELIIILQSNSINLLREIIDRIRRMQVKELSNYDYIIDNSVFLSFPDVNCEDRKKHPVSNHVFESSSTTIGLHEDVYNPSQPKNAIQPLYNEEIKLISKWSVKPGHLDQVLHHVRNYIKKYKCTIDLTSIAGNRGDLLVTKTIKINKGDLDKLKKPEDHPLFFPGALFTWKTENDTHTNDEYEDEYEDINPLVETYTTVGFSVPKKPKGSNANNNNSNSDKKKNIDIYTSLEIFQISPDVIANIRISMRTIRVPKVLADKVIKLFANYNNAVKNSEMYAFYIELYLCIKVNIIDNIAEYANAIPEPGESNKYHAGELISKLEDACNYLEYGFENRFYQSYWTSEILDVNLDYSGGLQNLISSYDSCFKVLNNAFLPNTPNATFVCVKSDNRVMATPHALLLNYLHLIQPYIFSAIAIHETSNFAFNKLYFDNIQRLKNPDNGYNEKSAPVVDPKQIIKLSGLLSKADININTEYYSPELIKEINQNKKLIFNINNSRFASVLDDLNNLSTPLGGFLNYLTFRYFCTDYTNYYYGCEKEYKLFCKTSWAYFIQLGNIYQKHDLIDHQAFITMSIRMALIKHYSLKDEQSEKEVDYYPSPEDGNMYKFLQKSIDIYRNTINNFVAIITKTNEIELDDWFTNMTITLDNILNEIKKPEEKEESGLNELTETIHQYLFNSEDILIDETLTAINHYCKKHEKTNEETNQTNCLLPVYRYIIHQTINYYSKEMSILPRDPTCGSPDILATEIPEIKDGYINLMVDQCGGTFIISEKNRKHYLTTRIKFIRLMFHLSQLHKKKYTSYIITENKKAYV